MTVIKLKSLNRVGEQRTHHLDFAVCTCSPTLEDILQFQGKKCPQIDKINSSI